KLCRPVDILWASVVKAGKGIMPTSMVSMALIPMLYAMGTPIASKKKKVITSIKTLASSIFY
ncbi:MAG: hypothetical protein V2I34_06800, partial [Bacteroidales bacterium]|nr:hypothetical protein [Bacteroidales bacterium]